MPGDHNRAYCTYCKKDLIAHKKSLREHGKTKIHIENCKLRKECAKIPKITEFAKQIINDARKRAELKIAVFIAEHCSINSVDHLSKIVMDLDPNSQTLANIKLHRTKCSGNKYLTC